jgi:hypothetical protein
MTEKCGADAVGYGSPPRATRFRKGRSSSPPRHELKRRAVETDDRSRRPSAMTIGAGIPKPPQLIGRKQ